MVSKISVWIEMLRECSVVKGRYPRQKEGPVSSLQGKSMWHAQKHPGSRAGYGGNCSYSSITKSYVRTQSVHPNADNWWKLLAALA